MYDKSSDSDSDTAINNICARKKAISIQRKNVLSTSESEDDYVEDALSSTSSNNIKWAMENVQLRFHNFNIRSTGKFCPFLE